VVSRILSEDGEVLAEWLLMCNIMDMDASTLALWYYWRWQIECFFKLLKSAGHHLESWQQESAQAIAKRLLVASMACATVWAIAADNSKEAAELRAFLVKLSGRQMRHKKEFTNPALLAGLWVFLSMLEIMGSYSQEELDQFESNCPAIFRKSCVDTYAVWRGVFDRLSQALHTTGVVRYHPRELRRCRTFYVAYPEIRGTLPPNRSGWGVLPVEYGLCP